MSDNSEVVANDAPKRKSHFWLWACLLTFAVLLLGAVGVWKSSNFTFTEKLDYFVCTGTLDDEPLLAELNFQKDKDVLALIVFADGRHWSLTKHRVENGRHVWSLLDPESNVVGTLSGEWQATTGTFEGQLEQGLAEKKTSRVALRQYAQFEHSVSMIGLKIGPFGQRSRFESVLPQVPLDSPLHEEMEASRISYGDNFLEDLAVSLQLLANWQEPEESYQSLRHLLYVTENAVSYKELNRYSTGEWAFSLASVVLEHGQVQWLVLDDELLKPKEQRPEGRNLLREPYDRLNAELRERGRHEIAIPDFELLYSSGPMFTFSLEPSGMRVNFTPEITGGKDEFEFVIPWANVRPFLREDGPAKHFMPAP